MFNESCCDEMVYNKVFFLKIKICFYLFKKYEVEYIFFYFR